jgi:riboflavin biosynthesis pyrimidine reductase
MDDTEPQTAAAKVLWHFTMSLDGFVAGPEHDMHWLTGVAVRPGLIDEIDLHIAPILLGAGIRLYDNPADDGMIRLHRVGDGDPASTVNVRYRPVTTGRCAAGSPGAAQALDREGIPC